MIKFIRHLLRRAVSRGGRHRALHPLSFHRAARNPISHVAAYVYTRARVRTKTNNIKARARTPYKRDRSGNWFTIVGSSPAAPAYLDFFGTQVGFFLFLCCRRSSYSPSNHVGTAYVCVSPRRLAISSGKRIRCILIHGRQRLGLISNYAKSGWRCCRVRNFNPE